LIEVNVMLSTPTQLVTAFLLAMSVMLVLWFVQRGTGNAGIVDIGWAAVIGVLGVFFAATSTGYLPRRILAAVLIAIWSLRLSMHLFRRIVGEPEDGRYVALKQKWGPRWPRKMFRFYQIQALAAFAFAMPILLVSQNARSPLGIFDLLGVATGFVGVVGVTLADRQLDMFRSRAGNRGKTCRAGLWKFSRHPNYFFEWIHWCAYVPLAFGATAWYLTALVPAVLLYFIFRVTGIPPTEAQALLSRGDDYRHYQKTTSAFVPWFPRKKDQIP
jgi:steroid 5-alpha reductase family enzyme